LFMLASWGVATVLAGVGKSRPFYVFSVAFALFRVQMP
jgi:arginine/ornithine N-succinyltransferase beta subunit